MRGSQSYWRTIAENELISAINLPKISNARPKNMILFIGDGMSIPTLTATRFYKAQQQKADNPGRTVLAFEDSPFTAMSKTYTDDYMVPDSAATATAMLTGVKINSMTVGVDSNVQFENCSSYATKYNVNTNIFKYAKEAGMSTGVVTTTPLTHATPASSYAHTPSRYWMSDKDVNAAVSNPELRKNCPDIASQFLTNGIDINVALAGGREQFLPIANGGVREDRRNLIDEWRTKQTELKRIYQYVDDKTTLADAAAQTSLQHVLGLFYKGEIPYADEMNRTANANVPTLAEMVTAAIKILSRNDKGFFLMVEGGRIDQAHHASFGRRALEETLGLEKAYETARELTNSDDTLLVVTADHSHVFSIAGYPSRGKDILSTPDQGLDGRPPGIAADGKPYTTLLYANGPEAPNNKVRPNPNDTDTFSPTYRQQSAVPLNKETHGADDVGIYGRGPMAHLIHGVREQNYIAHVFMYAGCLGPYSGKVGCDSNITSASLWLLAVSLMATIRAILPVGQI